MWRSRRATSSRKMGRWTTGRRKASSSDPVNDSGIADRLKSLYGRPRRVARTALSNFNRKPSFEKRTKQIRIRALQVCGMRQAESPYGKRLFMVRRVVDCQGRAPAVPDDGRRTRLLERHREAR